MKKALIALLLLLLCLGGCDPAADQITSPPPSTNAESSESPSPDSTETPSAVPSDDPTNADTTVESGTPQGYMFLADGQEIYACMEAEPILTALPEPSDIYETTSCAFDGVDITYFYPGFELTTYPDNGKEYILSVVLVDDSVTTPEGIYLGSTLSEVTAAYGTATDQVGTQYSYTKGGASLVITLEDDYVVGIVYSLDLE